jgi:hypothetical protein
MSESSLPTTRPKHARSTSITTSTKKTTSHQRKSSVTLQQQLQQQQQHFPAAKQSSYNKSPAPSATSTTTASAATTNNNTFIDTINAAISRVHVFLNPSGPLLPHSKHGAVKPSFFHSLLQSRVIRFVALFYLIFSVFLSLNHTWKYLSSPNSIQPLTHDIVQDSTQEDWVPQRTYDQGKKKSISS